MSENNSTTTPPAAAPPAPPAAPTVTPEHISAFHRHLDQVKDFVVAEFHKAVAFVRKEAPVIEAGAAAVASAIPGVGPIAAAIGKAAGEAAAVAAACCGHETHFWSGACATPGCSCTAGPKAVTE